VLGGSIEQREKELRENQHGATREEQWGWKQRIEREKKEKTEKMRGYKEAKKRIEQGRNQR